MAELRAREGGRSPINRYSGPGGFNAPAPPAPLTSPYIVAVFVLLFSIYLLFCSSSYLFVYVSTAAALSLRNEYAGGSSTTLISAMELDFNPISSIYKKGSFLDLASASKPTGTRITRGVRTSEAPTQAAADEEQFFDLPGD